jgi:hypothetical protein
MGTTAILTEQREDTMRQNRFNISTGVIEVNYPITMTAEDVQDFRDAMAITFRVMERIAMNGQPAKQEATGEHRVPQYRDDGQ